MVRFASCESDCPVLLGGAGLLRQYIPVLLRNRGDPSPRPFGLFPPRLRCSASRTAPVGARIRASLHCVDTIVRFSINPAQRKRARAGASAAGCRQMGPLWRGERVEEKPEGSRAGCARVGCEHTDVLSDDPVVPEKRREVRFAGCESDRRVRCLAFLVTFWAMPKSNRLARRARRTLCTSKKQHRAKSWIPAFAGMTSFRAFAATAGVGTAAIRKEAAK